MEREDHDQRFKTLIKEFFLDFMRLFFVAWEKYLDFLQPEWLSQEAFPEPPDGPRRLMDVVAKIRTREAVPGYDMPEHSQMMALVHIEIESADSIGSLSKRMFEYDNILENEHGLPVLSIALLINLAFDGMGQASYGRQFFGVRKLQFEYFYVGLRGLDAVQYVQGDNWLGVALSALMRMPADRVAWVGAEALRRLSARPLTEQHRRLLVECVQAYLPLDEQQRAEFDRILEAKPYEGVKAMNKTIYEQGLEKGVEKGRQEGRQEGHQEGQRMLLRDLVENRFGPLPNNVLSRLEQLPFERIGLLAKEVLRAHSLKDLGLED